MSSPPQTHPADCACLERGPPGGRFDETFVGVDETNGRFGEVSIRTCRDCGRRWLHYHVEYEAFSRSGRWYSGLLPDAFEGNIRPGEAVPLMAALPWHVYGGSFFGHAGRRGTGRIEVDAMAAADPPPPVEPAARAVLVQVLRDARALLARPDNDFDWSSWLDAEHALREVDGLIGELEGGGLPPRGAIEILFLPTGPMQEVALSSGWGDAFLAVADRYDAAAAAVYRRPPG